MDVVVQNGVDSRDAKRVESGGHDLELAYGPISDHGHAAQIQCRGAVTCLAQHARSESDSGNVNGEDGLAARTRELRAVAAGHLASKSLVV